jgi:N-acetylmuramoyl-L-alanine amidase
MTISVSPVVRRLAGSFSLAVVLLASGCAAVAPVRDSPTPRRGHLAGAVVVVDAGHPSENGHGTTSRRGTVESHITLAVSRRLQTLLEERGATVVMTRTELNQVVSNRERAEIANRAGAHLMVRLHCDARPESGTATYYPDRRGTSPDGSTGPSDEVIALSERLARIFHPALISAMGPGWGDLGVLGDSRTAVGARQGALTGSIHSRVPAVTVEMVSLSNPRDDALITRPDGQDRMARALLAGIEAYLLSPAIRSSNRAGT